MAKTWIGYPGIQADELKIISLTLEKLLRNLPRLEGYTQQRTFLMSTEGLRSSAMRFNSALRRSGA